MFAVESTWTITNPEMPLYTTSSGLSYDKPEIMELDRRTEPDIDIEEPDLSSLYWGWLIACRKSEGTRSFNNDQLQLV